MRNGAGRCGRRGACLVYAVWIRGRGGETCGTELGSLPKGRRAGVCVCVCWRCVTEGRLGEWEQRGRRWRGRMGWGVSVSEGARGGSLARTHPHSHSPTDACTRTERIAFWSGAQHAHTHKNTHKHTGKLTRTCTPTDCAEPQCIPCAA